MPWVAIIYIIITSKITIKITRVRNNRKSEEITGDRDTVDSG